MQNATSLGMNRTGTQMAPLSASSMESYAEQNSPAPEGTPGGPGIAEVRFDYVHDAERVGSVPLPGTLTGAVSTTMAKLTGKKPEVLVDKLGERLAFERSGVRLYQALIDKVSGQGGSLAMPFTIADLQHIRDEELEHLRLVTEAIESIGADPTAETPSADVVGVASMGVMQVLTDPRTNIGQSLCAILTAELTDGAGWELLIRLAEEAGQDNLLPEFRKALAREGEHEQKVRDWLTKMVLDEAA